MFHDMNKEFRDREKRLEEREAYRENLRKKFNGEEYNCCVLSETWMNVSLKPKIQVKKCLECGKISEIRSK